MRYYFLFFGVVLDATDAYTINMAKSKSGFTIIELVIVIVIIGILATITLVAYNGTQARGRDTRRRTDINNMVKALELYYADNGSYPVPSGSPSPLGSSWYASSDSSWNTFKTTLTTIDNLPSDPRNAGSPLAAGGYAYAYYSGSNCGHTAGQWYLIVYRYEAQSKEKYSGEGTCPSGELGDTYYAGGASYYRVLR